MSPAEKAAKARQELITRQAKAIADAITDEQIHVLQVGLGPHLKRREQDPAVSA
jgi:hypothetical protein